MHSWQAGVPDVPDVPLPEGKAGAHLLNEVRDYLRRFVAYPTEWASTAHALWIAHAHVVDVFENTPRLGFISPEPGSGKSRALEMTEALVPRPVLSVNASTAYIFRKISDEAGLPTLLLDEVDAIFAGGKTDASEDLRGLLNSGYRRGATAGRAAIRGKEIVTEEWPSFCAVALAGLNQLPDTLMTRSVVVRMKRRRPDQKVEPYRRRVNGEQSDHLNIRLAEWGEEVREDLETAWPTLPEEIQDRDADVWEPLIAVADAAGGEWPSMARAAAVAAVTESKSKPASLGVQLLTDIRRVMADSDRISTTELLDALHDLETAPWSSLRGEPIDARFLARTLSKYEIEPTKIRVGVATVRGYHRSAFADAWERYCPPPFVPETEQAEQAEQAAESASSPSTSCRVCGHPLWSPKSLMDGICGKTDDAHTAERRAA
ncbi:DUF3631 domain-containing protein [Microbacterium sp. CCNWLW134]|uniref:DUF3631 domain-containing protein n=1 Tax=Microbacterium sp. CCNWLW134 TaxID=3122064 RepID=UPI0030105F00